MKSRPPGDREARREEALRPSRHLGYDHDQLGRHLLEKEAYAIAEREFRRAIWLNPYEPAFKAHLAFCFYRQGRLGEARELLESIAGDGTVESERKELLDLIRKKAER